MSKQNHEFLRMIDWTELNWSRAMIDKIRHSIRFLSEFKGFQDWKWEKIWPWGGSSTMSLISARQVCMWGKSSQSDSSVQSQSPAWLFAMPRTAGFPASLSITTSQSLLKLTSINSVMPSNHLILCHPLLPPSIPPSIRVFSNESALHIRWPEYWSFSFSISPSNEHPGLISLGWTGWISLQSKGLSRVFSNTTVQKHQFLALSFLHSPIPTSIHDHWKNHSLD